MIRYIRRIYDVRLEAVTKRGITLEDLCRPRAGRVNAKATGRAFQQPFEVAYREALHL